MLNVDVEKEFRAKVIEAVDEGMEFLNDEVPFWQDDVDIQTLDMATWNECLLGQMYGNFGLGLEALGIDEDEAQAMGFISPPGALGLAVEEEVYAMLTGEWVSRIA